MYCKMNRSLRAGFCLQTGSVLWRLLTLIVVVSLMPAAYCAPTLEEFFAAAPDAGAGLDPNNVYPQGRQFGFTFWSLPAESVPNAKTYGITVIGPYYSGHPYDDTLNDAQVISVQSDVVNLARA